MKKVTSGWVSHQRTDQQKQQRVKLCREHLAKFQNGKTKDHNCNIENCLKPVAKAMWKQRRSADTKGIKLLHGNARPHIRSDVINYLTEEGINIMPHPPYSLGLVPCDYCLNDYIKRNLIG
ncbi:unnamed protein product [Rotaria magnacalcarata]|uniref:Transposase n=1 Tax=Rotaria magnacalcarata TaxID=392030 RepID=A0A8S2RL76_9BILA|nr:unnamed protein product [Rotaria magnacalcarata]